MRIVRRNTELGLILLGTLVTVGAYVLASLAEDVQHPRPTSGRSSASCSACSWPPTSPSGGWPRRPTARSAASPGCSTASATCSSSASTRPRPTPRASPACRRPGRRSASSPSSARSLVVRRVRDLERYRWTIGVRRRRPAAAAARPRRRAHDQRRQIWVGIGPISFQPGEFAKILLALFFASYLVEKRELLAVSSFRVGPDRSARPEAPRPGAPRVGRLPRRHVSGEGPRQLAAVLRPVRGDAVGGHGAGVVPRRRRSCCSARGRCSRTAQFNHVQDASTIWLDPWQDPKDDGLPDRRVAFAFAAGGVTGTGLGLGSPHPHPVGRDRLHLRRHRRGARPRRRHRRARSPSC